MTRLRRDFLDEQGKGACGRYISWPRSHAMCFATPGRPVQWARLLKRVFNIDIETCVHCGGPLKMIAAIEDPPVIRKILIHLGLSPQPPLRAPARYDPHSEADIY